MTATVAKDRDRLLSGRYSRSHSGFRELGERVNAAGSWNGSAASIAGALCALIDTD